MSEGWVDKLIGADQSGWRLLMFVGATPALLTVFVRIFVPESKRWQHAAKTAPQARIRDIFQPGLRHKTILGTCLGGLALIGTWASLQWVTPWANKLAADTENGARPPRLSRSAWQSAPSLAPWPPRNSPSGSAVARHTLLMSLASLLVCAYMYRSPLHFPLTAGWLERIDPNQYLFGGERAFNWQFILLAGLAGCVTSSFYGWLPLYLPSCFPRGFAPRGRGLPLTSAASWLPWGPCRAGSCSTISTRTMPAWVPS